MIHFREDTATIFINRACPRNCVQCGLVKERKKHLSIDEWIEQFTILKNELGIKFYLFLGTEPLLFGGELAKLIKWFHKNNLFYAFYSTSIPSLFHKYKEGLLDAGLNNWAAGIDTLPNAGWTDPITEKKTKESVEGLIWMGERGVQTAGLVTVTNQNLNHIPEIVEWCQENIPNVLSCINPVEWRHNDSFDFFAKKEDMQDMVIPDSRHDEVVEMSHKMLELSRRKGYKIQNSDFYLLNYPRYYNTLNYRCNGVTGIGIDCDGSLRLCGYSKGKRTHKYFIEDLKHKKQEVLQALNQDAIECEGCYWAYAVALQESFEAVLIDSPYYTERHKQPIPNIFKLYK